MELWLSGRGAVAHSGHVYCVATANVPGDSSATTKYFIVRMGANHKDGFGHVSTPIDPNSARRLDQDCFRT